MQGRTVDKRISFGDLLEQELNATDDDVIELASLLSKNKYTISLLNR